MSVRLVPVDELGAPQRALLADHAFDSFAEYYGQWRDDRAVAISVLAQELNEPLSELGASRAIFVGEALAGMMAAYPGEELADRQQASLLCHLRSGAVDPERILPLADTQRREVPPINCPHHYLARFAISPQYRGQGIADAAVAWLCTTVPQGTPIGLHVFRENRPATAFYRKKGFERFDAADLAYQALLLRR